MLLVFLTLLMLERQECSPLDRQDLDPTIPDDGRQCGVRSLFTSRQSLSPEECVGLTADIDEVDFRHRQNCRPRIELLIVDRYHV